MDSIGIIASIIAAITGIAAMITGIMSIRNSKGAVIKRMEKKQDKINRIEHEFYKTHKLYDDISRYYPYRDRISKLNKEIKELQKKI